jgi:hypothetical protein
LKTERAIPSALRWPRLRHLRPRPSRHQCHRSHWKHGWYAAADFKYMIHKGTLDDVILGAEYQHFELRSKTLRDRGPSGRASRAWRPCARPPHLQVARLVGGQGTGRRHGQVFLARTPTFISRAIFRNPEVSRASGSSASAIGWSGRRREGH